MNLTEIKNSEGFSSKAYKMKGDRWTYGYGNTFKLDGSPVKEGDTITKEDAEKLLQIKVEKEYKPQLMSLLRVTQSENQISALLSLIYNIGAGNLKKSNVLFKINSKAPYEEIESAWKVQNIRIGSQFEKGLRARRMREVTLYFS